MKCDKCGGKVRAMFNLTLSIPGEFVGHLTKGVIRRADVEMWGADWGSMSITCTNPKCRSIRHTGRYAPRPAQAGEKEDAR